MDTRDRPVTPAVSAVERRLAAWDNDDETGYRDLAFEIVALVLRDQSDDLIGVRDHTLG
jgi:hypothetical protein